MTIYFPFSGSKDYSHEIYMMMYVKTLGETPQVAERRIPVSVWFTSLLVWLYQVS